MKRPLLSQGGNTIRQLLKIAKKAVPEEEWSRTPVVLKATAGLRLLPEDKANALLKEVRRSFSLALRQFGTNSARPAKGAGWKTTEKPLLTSITEKKKQGVCLFGGYCVAKKNPAVVGLCGVTIFVT